MKGRHPTAEQAEGSQSKSAPKDKEERRQRIRSSSVILSPFDEYIPGGEVGFWRSNIAKNLFPSLFNYLC